MSTCSVCWKEALYWPNVFARYDIFVELHGCQSKMSCEDRHTSDLIWSVAQIVADVQSENTETVTFCSEGWM